MVRPYKVLPLSGDEIITLNGLIHILIDSTTPSLLRQNEYGIVPLDCSTTHWNGHWGEQVGGDGGPHISGANPPYKRSDLFDDLLLVDCINWHDRFVQNGQGNCPGKQDFAKISRGGLN